MINYPDVITLKFDPFNCDCEDTKEVFLNETARKIYLLWRYNHITSQYFADSVLKLARVIDEMKPEDAQQLASCFSIAGITVNPKSIDFPWKDIVEFAESTIEYFSIHKDKRILYRIEHNG